MDEEERFATASLGAFPFALAVGVVAEVLELGTTTRVPRAPQWIVGLCNLRGQVLPIVDLAEVLGIAHEAPTKLLVADLEGKRLGLGVGAIGDVVRAERLIGEVPRTLALELRRLVRTLIGVSDRVLPVLDPVLLSQQIAALT
jgi:purine-binding chemotaxis protein CheW